MNQETETQTASAGRSDVLVVTDWKVDPRAMVAACRDFDQVQPASFSLLVPARLHGLDWIGDPFASVPCARRALAETVALLETAGLAVNTATVGDPDPVAAITDITLDHPVELVLICDHASHPSLPFDLTHRTRRTTGLPTRRLGLPDAPSPTRRSLWSRLQRGHCALASPKLA